MPQTTATLSNLITALRQLPRRRGATVTVHNGGWMSVYDRDGELIADVLTLTKGVLIVDTYIAPLPTVREVK